MIECALELMAAGVEIPSGEVQKSPLTEDGEDLEQAGQMPTVVALLEKAYDDSGIPSESQNEHVTRRIR